MIEFLMNLIRLNICFAQLRKQHLKIREKGRWKRAFFHFLCSIGRDSSDYPGRWRVIEGFTRSDIMLLKKAEKTHKKDTPILICVLLNEIERISIFLEHYREIGITKFAIIDNGSTDRTLDYLQKQMDVDLFQTKDNFESKIKVGWINRIISYYGTQYWYLVVDADEMLVWHNVEKTSIQSVIKHLCQENITRVRALMVDMYPKEIKWDTDEPFEKIYMECKYFDSDTYTRQKSKELYLISGGPRKRRLGITAWLTKYPLFQLRENEVMCNPHVIYPYERKYTPCYLALLHYKFMTRNDQRKMRKYARKENYVCNSAEYKIYVKKRQESAENFNFYFDRSVEYKDSGSLEKIKEIDGNLVK